jgi:ribonucleoside-diphosphate reductase alpha chain
VKLQKISQEIYELKYQYKDPHGNPIDKDIHDTNKRVARTLANIEHDPELWYDNFLWALENGAICAGRITSNAGTSEFKSRTSTINCTMSGIIHDNLPDIFQKLKEAAITMQYGCGIGFDFSNLRSKTSWVNGVGATSSGPLSFMDAFDTMALTISSSGSRRSAMMATFFVHHPDILDVIKAKQTKGRLRKFNISILLTDEFMYAVRNKENYLLYFPVTKDELDIFKYSSDQLIYKKWSVVEDNYIVDKMGMVLCKIYDRLPAEEIYNEIMKSTYTSAEPGCLFVDTINRYNNLYFSEYITATNPCGT